MTDRAAQIDGFLDASGWGHLQRDIVAGDASNRRYERVLGSDGRSAILMDAPPSRNESVMPFVQIADHLRNVGLSAPEIYARDVNTGLLLIEDFGDALFATLMESDPAREISLYRDAVDVLLHLHQTPAPDLAICDTKWLVDMLSPVFEWYAPEAEQRDIAVFLAVFEAFAEEVSAAPPVMILRDFHARNLMFLANRVGLQQTGILDFQDAMRGHPAYDLVSILQDARRDVSKDTEGLILAYMLENSAHDPKVFRRSYAVLGLQRNLRILGIFARLCLRDGKTHYVDLIPRVWGYVTRNLQHPDLSTLADPLNTLLPEPTSTFLEHMKRQCPLPPSLP